MNILVHGKEAIAVLRLMRAAHRADYEVNSSDPEWVGNEAWERCERLLAEVDAPAHAKPLRIVYRAYFSKDNAWIERARHRTGQPYHFAWKAWILDSDNRETMQGMTVTRKAAEERVKIYGRARWCKLLDHEIVEAREASLPR